MSKYYIYILSILLIVLPYVRPSEAAVLELNFDSTSNIDNNILAHSSPGNIGNITGVIGRGYRFRDGECIKLNTNRWPSMSEGTLMFWVRPEWDYYQNDGKNLLSHTFFSARWRDGAYFVVSDGWWEKDGGASETYFVLNNRQLLNIHSKIVFKKHQWIHLAVTWSNGENGEVAIYLNGEKVAYKAASLEKQNGFKDAYIGCDSGTFLRGNRFVDSTMDEIKIFYRALSEDEILDQSEIGKKIDKTVLWQWMNKFTTDYTQDDQPVSVREKRYIFDSYPASWQTREQALDTIKRIKMAGFNVYVPCVWYGDGARFRSKVAPLADYIGPGTPFKTLLEIAHQYDIEVHPWVTVAYRSRDFLSDYYDVGTPPDAFELHNEDFRKFIVSLIQELVSNYEIDGINLDYVRTMGLSKSKRALSLYSEQYGSDLLVDINKLDSKKNWPANVQRFIDYPVENILSRVSKYIRTVKPELIIGVDGHPIPHILGKSREGRHETSWINRGIVDRVFIMSYSKHLDVGSIEMVRREMDDPDKLIVLLGAFDKVDGKAVSRPIKLINRHLKYVRKRWGNGFGLYPLSLLTDYHLSHLATSSQIPLGPEQ